MLGHGSSLIVKPTSSHHDVLVNECQEADSFTAPCPGRRAKFPRAGELLSRGPLWWHRPMGTLRACLARQVKYPDCVELWSIILMLNQQLSRNGHFHSLRCLGTAMVHTTSCTWDAGPRIGLASANPSCQQGAETTSTLGQMRLSPLTNTGKQRSRFLFSLGFGLCFL